MITQITLHWSQQQFVLLNVKLCRLDWYIKALTISWYNSIGGYELSKGFHYVWGQYSKVWANLKTQCCLLPDCPTAVVEVNWLTHQPGIPPSHMSPLDQNCTHIPYLKGTEKRLKKWNHMKVYEKQKHKTKKKIRSELSERNHHQIGHSLSCQSDTAKKRKLSLHLCYRSLQITTHSGVC